MESYVTFSFKSYQCSLNLGNSKQRFRYLGPSVLGLLLFVLSCVVITSTTYILVKAMKSASRVSGSLKWQGTLATLSTAFFYISSAAPIIIYRIVEYIYSTKYNSAKTLSVHYYRAAECCILLNTISNFYIYFLTVTSFREFVLTTICSCNQSFRNVSSSLANCK